MRKLLILPEVFVIGGPQGDTGLTVRTILVDNYFLAGKICRYLGNG